VRGEEDEVEERGAVKAIYHKGHEGTQRKDWMIAPNKGQQNNKVIR
jgi:hypothetical protein